jgi:hypothetical protein
MSGNTSIHQTLFNERGPADRATGRRGLDRKRAPTVNNKLTDAQIIEAIEHVFATEQAAGAAIRKVREILAPVAPAGGLPDYDFETATEGERWAYDQGYEDGHEARENEGYPPINEAQIAALSFDDLMALIKTFVDTAVEEHRAALNEHTALYGGAVIELPDSPEGGGK